MKAEQRKELETNTLADKMGRMVQRVKTGQRRTLVVYFLLGALAIVVLLVAYRYWEESNASASMQWLNFYDGSLAQTQELAKEKETIVGKAAKLQIAWALCWDLGIKSAAADKIGAMDNLKKAEALYQELAEEYKDDKVFEPQAILGQAVCNESLAVQDSKRLKTAKELYTRLQETKYDGSPASKFAKERLAILNDEKASQELAATYENLRLLFRIDAPFNFPQMPLDQLHKFQPKPN